MPKTNQEFWKNKFAQNVERDIRKKLELRKLHWNVVIIWECEINSDVNSVVNEIIESV